MGILSTITSPIRFSWNYARENLNPVRDMRDSIQNVISDNLKPREHTVDDSGEIIDFDPSSVFEANVEHFQLTKGDLIHKEKQFYRAGVFNSVLAVLSSGLIALFLVEMNWFAFALAIGAGVIWSIIALHNFYRAWQIRERKLEHLMVFVKNPEFWFR